MTCANHITIKNWVYLVLIRLQHFHAGCGWGWEWRARHWWGRALSYRWSTALSVLCQRLSKFLNTNMIFSYSVLREAWPPPRREPYGARNQAALPKDWCRCGWHGGLVSKRVSVWVNVQNYVYYWYIAPLEIVWTCMHIAQMMSLTSSWPA